MWLQTATADSGEEQIPAAFQHHLFSCQQPKTPSHYCASNSSSSFLEICFWKFLWRCGPLWARSRLRRRQWSLKPSGHFWFITGGYNKQVLVLECECAVVMLRLGPQFTAGHTALLPHSVCSPIYENALSPDPWEAPVWWSIPLSCQGLVCEKGRCAPNLTISYSWMTWAVEHYC